MSYTIPKVQKVLVQPINLIFRFLQNRTPVRIWIYGEINHKFEGIIVGFDEYMNLVLEETVEILSTGERKLGRILFRGENITLIQKRDEEIKV